MLRNLKKKCQSKFSTVIDDLQQFRRDAVNEAMSMCRDFRSNFELLFFLFLFIFARYILKFVLLNKDETMGIASSIVNYNKVQCIDYQLNSVKSNST